MSCVPFPPITPFRRARFTLQGCQLRPPAPRAERLNAFRQTILIYFPGANVCWFIEIHVIGTHRHLLPSPAPLPFPVFSLSFSPTPAPLTSGRRSGVFPTSMYNPYPLSSAPAITLPHNTPPRRFSRLSPDLIRCPFKIRAFQKQSFPVDVSCPHSRFPSHKPLLSSLLGPAHPPLAHTIYVTSSPRSA